MTKLREFTKQDWYGYAGAESAPGKPPMIREAETWMGACDIHGIMVTCDDASAPEGAEDWFLPIPGQKYELAKFILENLPESIDSKYLETLGFV